MSHCPGLCQHEFCINIAINDSGKLPVRCVLKTQSHQYRFIKLWWGVIISFYLCLLHLHNQLLIILDFVMMCLLIPLAMPHIQFLFVGTGICSLAYFSAWIAPNHPRIAALRGRHCGLLMFRVINPAHKRLALSGFLFLRTIFIIQAHHSVFMQVWQDVIN